MATSGSVDFNLDMAEITEEAFERCGLEFRTGYDARTARRSLNLLFAEWANRGLNLWTVEEITQTLAQLSTSSSVASYPIGGDHNRRDKWFYGVSYNKAFLNHNNGYHSFWGIYRW